MLRVIRHWFYRPAVRMGPVDNSCIQITRTRNAQFVSYLIESGFRQVNGDRYESSLRRRRLVKRALFLSLAGAAAWVAIESARAISMF
jgi:hypothetical protein